MKTWTKISLVALLSSLSVVLFTQASSNNVMQDVVNRFHNAINGVVTRHIEKIPHGIRSVVKTKDGETKVKVTSATDDYTIYKPYIKFQLTSTNYQGVKKSGYSWNDAPPNNTNISWENWLKFERVWSTNWYTTIWYDMWNLFRESRNIQISYDVIFKNNAEWGGINIANAISIDVNPNQVWFRWPNVFNKKGIKPNELHHVDIYINEVDKDKFDVKVYVDDIKKAEHIYTIENYPNLLNKIGLRSNYYRWTVIYNNLVVIPQDMQKIGNNEEPIHTYYIDNGKEKYKYTYVGYYKPFWPNRGHWNVELVWCVWDYSLTPTTDGGKRCEMWCTVGSSKIGYCRIK